MTNVIRLLLLGTLWLAGSIAAAGSLDADAPPRAVHPLAGDWYMGGRLEAEYLHEVNYDLEVDVADDIERWTFLHPSLALAWRPEGPWSLYLNIEYEKRSYTLSPDRPMANHARFDLDKLHVDYRMEDVYFRLGRQRIKNHREWMIDDTQDGGRLVIRHSDLVIDAALLRERAFTESLRERDPVRRADSLWLRLGLSATDEPRHRALFLMVHDDRDKNQRAAWVGIELAGEWDDLDYWFQGALVHGDHRGRRLRGIGFDLGGVYRLHKKPRIYAIAGFAFGSGDERDVDLGFRQTGYQDNAAKLGGVTRIAYYGEVFDPELANLAIATLGLGMRPQRNLSIDLLWHGYRQHHPLDKLRDTALSLEPNGDHHAIGQEWDLVVGYRLRGRLKLEAVLGRFRPGAAFDTRDDALLARFEVKYTW